MSAGTRLHRRAYRLARRVGEAVTFVDKTVTQDTTTGIVSTTETEVTGRMVRDEPNFERYHELGLTATTAQSCVFTPDTFGRSPSLNATVEYQGATYRVKEVEPFGPGGEPSVFRVIIAK